MNSSKLSQKVREKQFRLDCTNKQAVQYQEYNGLKDKYLRYLMPCPCNGYIRSKCHPNLTFHTKFEANESCLDASHWQPRLSRSRVAKSEPKVGKIIRNIKFS